MKREIALPFIAVSMLLLGCTAAAAPAERTTTEQAEVTKAAPASLASDATMKSIEISALDGATRLTGSMPNSDALVALRASLTAVASASARGDANGALTAVRSASKFLSEIDLDGRNPDAAAIQLLLNSAINQLSR